MAQLGHRTGELFETGAWAHRNENAKLPLCAAAHFWITSVYQVLVLPPTRANLRVPG